MKVLTLTSLFPGSANPRHGVFVRERRIVQNSRSGASNVFNIGEGTVRFQKVYMLRR